VLQAIQSFVKYIIAVLDQWVCGWRCKLLSIFPITTVRVLDMPWPSRQVPERRTTDWYHSWRLWPRQPLWTWPWPPAGRGVSTTNALRSRSAARPKCSRQRVLPTFSTSSSLPADPQFHTKSASVECGFTESIPQDDDDVQWFNVHLKAD